MDGRATFKFKVIIIKKKTVENGGQGDIQV